MRRTEDQISGSRQRVEGFRFRKASSADLPIVRDLATRIWNQVYPEIIGQDQIDYMLKWMYSLDRMQEELDAGATYLILDVQGAEAGFLAFHQDESPSIHWLDKLYLLPENHGEGFGAAMLAEAESRISAFPNAEWIKLRVNKNNRKALAAYDRAGYQTLEEICSDIGGGFVMDDYVMGKPLKS